MLVLRLQMSQSVPHISLDAGTNLFQITEREAYETASGVTS